MSQKGTRFLNMRVCDWIADYLFKQGITRVHGLMGGGAMGLNDGFIKHGKIKYICYHHEQGAGHAAIGDSKFTGKPAVVNPTTGCAGTNCATSVLNAWQDSVPLIFISGNVKLDSCSEYINFNSATKIRKYGVQEHNIVETYKDITKFAKFIWRVEEVAYNIQKAIYIATSDRPGPVWIDIPADIQTAEMPKSFETFDDKDFNYKFNSFQAETIKNILTKSNRPCVLAGYGIRQSNTVDQFIQFVEKCQIPFVSTYGARDYLPADHALNIGAVGIKGSRAGNFAMQNCDVLLILGSSLNGSVVGYDSKLFSPSSYKIMVDVDNNETRKNTVKLDLTYNCTLQEFFKHML